MAEYVAKRDRKRCPTHPGELLREDVIPATGKTRSEIAALLGISRQHLFGDGAGVWARMQSAYDCGLELFCSGTMASVELAID